MNPVIAAQRLRDLAELVDGWTGPNMRDVDFFEDSLNVAETSERRRAFGGTISFTEWLRRLAENIEDVK